MEFVEILELHILVLQRHIFGSKASEECTHQGKQCAVVREEGGSCEPEALHASHMEENCSKKKEREG